MKYLLTLLLILFGFASVSAQFEEPVIDLPDTEIEWEESTFDFGDIKEGVKAEHIYWFKNTGKNPLKIYNVKPSCGCTTPDWSKEEVPPGRRGFVKLSFDSKGKSGLQKKSVTVTSNTQPRTHVVNFSAEVVTGPNDGSGDNVSETRPPLLPLQLPPNPDNVIETSPLPPDVDPDNVNPNTNEALEIEEEPQTTSISFTETKFDFGNIKQGDVVVHEYEFTNTGTADLILENVKPSCGCTTPEWTKEPIKPGQKGTIKVQFDSKGKSGLQKKSVTVTANTEPKTTVLNFQGEVVEEPKGEMIVQGSNWVYPAKGTKTLKKEFTFTNKGEAPLTITGFEVECSCIKVEFPTRTFAPGEIGTLLVTFTRKNCSCEDYLMVHFTAEGNSEGGYIEIASEVVRD